MKRRYSPEQKMKLLREHLENQVPIGELATQYGIHPNALYQWKKELFEQGVEIFTRKRKHPGDQAAQAKLTGLEAKLKEKDSLISELVEDNLRYKKKLNGDL
jgi:transposase-like protein